MPVQEEKSNIRPIFQIIEEKIKTLQNNIIIKSTMAAKILEWQTLNKSGNSLRSPWISISREWNKVEVLAPFKIGNGRRVAFWTDSWVGDLPLKFQFPNLFRLAQLPNESVSAHWDYVSKSWSLFFRRLLKDQEIQDFLTPVNPHIFERINRFG